MALLEIPLANKIKTETWHKRVENGKEFAEVE